MPTYFNINYEFNREAVLRRIDETIRKKDKGYVCVADGVVVNHVQRDKQYREAVNGSLFSICDSSWVPLYIKWIYGKKYEQYCGSMIFEDLLQMRKYKMAFVGGEQKALQALRQEQAKAYPEIKDMLFYELPFKEADEFDYPAIAKDINKDGADIIWISLGAPKQELFMHRLLPHLEKGVMIAVGAVFKFYSGETETRAPQWVVEHHLEFIYRIMKDPRKQLKRCWGIIASMPSLLLTEYRKKNK